MATAPKIRLDDCCEIVAGATPSTSDESCWGGDIHWATPKDLSELDTAFISGTPRRLTHKGLESCAAKILPVGSVLFSSRAPIGHVAINTVPMATNQGFKSFIPDSSQVFAKYLYWWLKSNRAYLESLGNGATFKEVSKSIVSKIEIPLPPLAEQKRIAEVLDKAEELRVKRRAALAQLDSLTQSIFLEMFGDPVTNPKKIKVVRLAEVSTRITDGVHQKPDYTESGVPFISVKDITTGKLIFDHCKFISEDDHKRFTKRCKPERNDILYTKVGATYGRPAIVETDREFSLYVSVCIIKPRKELIDPNFLNAALGTSALKNQADRRIKGIGVPDLHLDQIQNFLIPLPLMSQQHEFALRVAAVEKLKATQRTSLAELDTLFVSLQHRAFRGEL
ncbi:MAG: restriction endonuclease subunit S [Chthoniobacterales bacterium]